MSRVSQEDKDQLRYDLLREADEESQHETSMKTDQEYAVKHLINVTQAMSTLEEFKRLCEMYELDFKEYLDYMIEEL